MEDETTKAAVKEELSICVRYVIKDDEGKYEVSENFMGFAELEQTEAETIPTTFLRKLDEWGVNMSKIRGQGYDGASNMSGHVSWVQARVKEKLPGARYFTHCANHCLNLVVVAGCTKVPEIRNFMTSFQELTFFCCASAKRKAVLHRHISPVEMTNILGVDEIKDESGLLEAANRRTGLPTLSDTRWLARVDSVCTLLVKFKQIHDFLLDIHDQSSGKAANDAMSFVNSMTQFSYIISAVICQYILAFIRPLSVALQSKSCDLVEAYKDAQNLVKVLEEVRNDKERYGRLFTRASEIAATVDVEPTKPRTAARQRGRANAPANSTQEYYRLNFFLPFVDHVLAHLKTRFSGEIKDALLGF